MLKRLVLKQFRNFSDLELNPHPQFNFIFGKNAQGKTNIIEAISYLSQLKSFRTPDKHHLIQKEAEFGKIKTLVTKDNLDWDIEITLGQKQRQIHVNGKRPVSRQDYFELLPTILFEPSHIYLFRDSPSERRHYLDHALFLQEPDIADTLKDYKKIITQKNKLLKEGVGLGTLGAWNEKLATLGGEIILKRWQWFQKTNALLTQEYQAVSGLPENLTLVYKPTENSNCRDFSEAPLGAVQTALRIHLEERQADEIARREAFVGPHRDDFFAQLENKNLGTQGSQGENRSAIIALKMAELKMFAQKFNKTPIFLLDDVASELDATRCHYLFSYLRDEAAQVFLTTTENELDIEEYQDRSASFLVEKGTVSQF